MKRRESYEQATLRLIRELADLGWETGTGARGMRWARDVRHEHTLLFNAQSVQQDGYPMRVDVRVLSAEQLIAAMKVA